MDFLYKYREYLLLLFAIVLMIASFPYTFVSLFTPKASASQSYEFNDATSLVIQNTYDTARVLLQSGLTLIAVSWGFVAIRDAQQGMLLRTWPSRFIFICGSACLMFSVLAYLSLADVISYYIQIGQQGGSHSFPEIGHSTISGYAQAQLFGMWAGAICIGLSVIASLWLDTHSSPRPKRRMGGKK